MSARNQSRICRRRNIAIIVWLVALCGTAVHCQNNNRRNRETRDPMPEYVQEFFMSEAVRSQEKGEFQLTLATESQHCAGSNADLQVEYGLTNRLQTSVEIPYGITGSRHEEENASGWSSFNVGVLFQFIRSDRPFALSAGMTMELPLRSRGELGYEPTILLAKSFRQLQVHASVLSEVENSKRSVAYNVAAVHPIKRVWFPTLEFNGRRGGKNSFCLTPGVYRHLRHRAEMGIGVPLGLGGVPNRRGIVLKTNWELGADND